MNRIIKTVVLILLVQKLSTAEAFMDETCELNREKEQQCRSYTYSVVKPMLDYLHQVSEELQESKSKDEIIKDLREKLVQQEMNEALIQLLGSEIDFQNRINSLTKSNKKFKTELARKSAELDRLNVDMKKLNFSLFQKNQEIAKININKNNEIEKLQSQNDSQKQSIERLAKIVENCDIL
ncbi:repetitive organellar protein-like [Drosophila nasuta]|uniref:repetitive organellar protein-like n=1 Tax=Drosophila nasuta TaxID=42062 RepID=UPI00295F0F49|nr:repetitive organellar protein-like [Drosophila nasuta]